MAVAPLAAARVPCLGFSRHGCWLTHLPGPAVAVALLAASIGVVDALATVGDQGGRVARG